MEAQAVLYQLQRERKVLNENDFSRFISSSALVCFEFTSSETGEKYKSCETFDGAVVEKLPFQTKEGHWEGALGFHKGKPTAVGGTNYPFLSNGYTETLTEKGWEGLTPHPR